MHTFLRAILIFVSVIIFNGIFAQDQAKLDSLFKEIKKLPQDTNKVMCYLRIGYQFQYSNQDTAMFYYNHALELARKLQQPYLEAKANNYMGIANEIKGNLDSAMVYYFNSLSIEMARVNKPGMSGCYNNVGVLYFKQGIYDKAIEYYKKSLQINEELGNLKLVSARYLNIGGIYQYQGNYSAAIENYRNALKIKKELNDTKGIAGCYTNIGLVHNEQGDYKKAIENYQRSMKIWEELDNKSGIAQCMTNLGNTHYNLKNYTKSIEYHEKALKLNEETGDSKGISNSYMNMGIVYWEQKMYPLALKCLNQSLEINLESGNKKGTAACYANLGLVYDEQGDYETAIDYYKKALEINYAINDKLALAIVLGNLAETNISLSNEIGSAAKKEKYALQAKVYGEEALNLATELRAMKNINIAAFQLLEANKITGDANKALKYAELVISTKDSLYSSDMTKAIQEMEAKYESEKKQLLIDNLEKDKALQNSKLENQAFKMRQQRIIIYSFILVLIIILVFSFLLYRMFLQKKKANIKLEEQNEEIMQQKEEIETQRDEIESQRDTVMRQKEHIEQINHEITDSIHYAKRIQSAILPRAEFADKHLPDHFVLFRPKDIVSGDFYWMTNIEGRTVFSVADCTGHGVPGAFMSMLGAAFLNEIVNKEYVTHTGVILRRLRKEVIRSLQQKGNLGEQKDGMDMVLCSFDTKTMDLQFSGANNPLYIVRKSDLPPVENAEKTEFGEFSLYEIKGDKMPIAIYERMDKFSDHEIKLVPGDRIYMFSDGYPDQFGGERGKKFKYKPFKQLLVENSQKSPQEQKEILNSHIEEWMSYPNHEDGKPYDQIDDITVAGICF